MASVTVLQYPSVNGLEAPRKVVFLDAADLPKATTREGAGIRLIREAAPEQKTRSPSHRCVVRGAPSVGLTGFEPATP